MLSPMAACVHALRSWNTQPPTRANITQEFQWLSQGAQPGDILFLHYSGHGTQTRDLDGDEADGYDEALVPLDHQSAGVITDDEVWSTLCPPPSRPGCSSAAGFIFRACSSPRMYFQGVHKEHPC